MCGICGIYQHREPVSPELLAAMTQVMKHRGPDDEGYFIDDNIGLGFRRLSIVDIENGHQPLANEDGTVWVVFNGEIYNYLLLRKNLEHKGHVFKSESDTEVIVHMYEEYGIDLLSRLCGMYSIGIVDLNSRSLYLARDHFGIKPLYYAKSSDRLVFASEIKSILKSDGFTRPMNMQAVWDYFTFQYVPGEHTIFSGIEKLAPGHYLRYREGSLSLHRYWAPEYHPDRTKPLSYFVEGVRHHLEASVQRHLQGSVPVGSFLSGGIDSNAIAALIRNHKENLHTFSIGFEDSPASMKELAQASEMANLLQTTHHSLMVSKQEFLERLPQALYTLEQPLADPSAIALNLIAEVARQYVTVVLSGEGADEVFGGYPIYHEPKSLAGFQYLPMSIRRAIGCLASTLPMGLKGRDFLIRGSKPLERRFVGNVKVFDEDAKLALLQRDIFPEPPHSSYEVTDRFYEQSEGLDDITRMQLIDLNTWLPGDILLKADKMTMAHSLELRVPYLDRTLFAFAATIPVEHRIAGRQGKHVLREAARPYLPEHAITRPKLGFPVPYRKWVSDQSEQIWDLFQSSPLRSWFNAGYIESKLRAHREGNADHGRELWALFTFLLWHQVMMKV